MAHIRMKIFSNALRGYTHVTIMLPTPTENHYSDENTDFRDTPFFKEDTNFKVLYLLHGTFGDDTDWSYYSNVERDIIGTDLMIVCPDGGNSWWADMNDGERQFTFLTEELPAYIQRIFPVSTKREDTYLAGLSMGGFATLNTAFLRPELYSAVCALSAGIVSEGIEVFKTRTYPWKLILDPPYDRAGSFIDGEMHLKEALKENKNLPRICLTIGRDDFLFNNVRKTREILDGLKVPYTYMEDSGEHNFEFWGKQIPKIIAWMLNE